MDFQEGARLEASGRSGPQIGMSLVRVQGAVRVKLEKARREARLQAAQQRALEQQAAPPATAVPGPAVAPQATDPFQNEGLRSGEVENVPTDPAAPTDPNADTTDPFMDEPKTPKPEDDPFGSGSSAPAATTTEDDPFK